MRRSLEAPDDRVGDVFAFERSHSLVDGLRFFFVAAETDFAETRFHHAGLDVRHAHRSAEKIHAHALADRANGELRRAVDGAARINPTACNGTDVDDVTLAARDEARKAPTSDGQEALHVRVDHLVDVVEIEFLNGVGAFRETGIVHENREGLGARAERVEGFERSFRIADVENEWEDFHSVSLFELRCDFFEDREAAAGDDEIGPARGESFCGRKTDSGCRARDERELRFQGHFRRPSRGFCREALTFEIGTHFVNETGCFDDTLGALSERVRAGITRGTLHRSAPVSAANYWLMKSEPESYSIDQLKADKKTLWSGVRNYQARNYMTGVPVGQSTVAMKPGELFFFYHSNAEQTGIVGLGKILKINQPDPTALDSKSEYYDPKSSTDRPIWFCVEVGFVEKWKTPITLAQLKAEKALAKMALLQKGSRLSVQPVSKAEFDHVMKMKAMID